MPRDVRMKLMKINGQSVVEIYRIEFVGAERGLLYFDNCCWPCGGNLFNLVMLQILERKLTPLGARTLCVTMIMF